MSAVEQRYRRALRWYPASWRQQNEEVVLGTLLDAEESGEPRRRVVVRAELAVLVLHGVVARFAFFTNPAARSLAASIVLASGFGYASFQFVIFDVHRLDGYATVGLRGATALPPGIDVSWVLPALWVFAVGAATMRHNALRVAALLAVPITVAVILVPRLVERSAGGVSRYALLFEVVTALVALVGVPARRTLVAALIGWVVAFAVVIAANDALRGTESLWIWALGPFNAGGLVLGLLAVMAVIGLLICVRLPREAGALTIAAVPWAVMLVAELATDRFNRFPPPYAAVWLTLIALCCASLTLLHQWMRRTAPERAGIVQSASSSFTQRSASRR